MQRTEKTVYSYEKMDLHDETNEQAAATLYSAYQRGVRVRIWYGNAETGHAWLEEFDVIGYVNLSMGPIHVPILLHNTRSIGGGAILDNCIIKIQETQNKQVLYEHPTFGRGHFRIGGEMSLWVQSKAPHLKVPVDHYHSDDENGWQNVANFKTWDQAVRWVDFMTGKRMTTGGRLVS